MGKRNKAKNQNTNRSYGKIQTLPVDVRDVVDEMLVQNYRYREIVDFIRDNTSVEVDTSMVCRYARKLSANLRELKIAQENMRVMMNEIQKHPSLDSVEAIARLLSSRVLDAVVKKGEDAWDEIDPLELLDKSTKLIRVATHKRDVDNKIKQITDIAIEGLREDFADMPSEEPELYRKLVEYLEAKQ
jgi:hypothetical protein